MSHSGAGDIVKKLQKLRDGGEVAIKRTVSDFATRGPGCTKGPASGRLVAFGGLFYSLSFVWAYIFARACRAEPWSLNVRFRYLSAFSA